MGCRSCPWHLGRAAHGGATTDNGHFYPSVAVRAVLYSTLISVLSPDDIRDHIHCQTMLITSDKEAAMQTTPPLNAELNTYGFPQGYFMLRSLATDRVLDVAQGLLDDGTCVILWPMTETSFVECKSVNSVVPPRATIHKIVKLEQP